MSEVRRVPSVGRTLEQGQDQAAAPEQPQADAERFTRHGAIPPVSEDSPLRVPAVRSASEQAYAGHASEAFPFAVDPRDLTPIRVAEILAGTDLMQRLAIMRVLRETRGNEFVQRVIAAEANPQVKKGDPITASILVRQVESGKENLRIEGPPAFRQRIGRELVRLATTHTGRAVIEELLAAPTPTIIKYQSGKAEQQGGQVRFDPGYRALVFDADGKQITSGPATVLMHELIHALHESRGELDAAYTSAPVRHPDYGNGEEENTIAGPATAESAPPLWSSAPMISAKAPYELTENSYRAEIREPARFGHKGELDPAASPWLLQSFRSLQRWVTDEAAEHDVGIDMIDKICDEMLAADQFEVTSKQIEALREKARAKQLMIWELSGMDELVEKYRR
jgi:hypothetical protein